MSRAFGIPIRTRWSSREVLVRRWLKQPGDTFRDGDPLVDLSIDGLGSTLRYSAQRTSVPEGGIYWHEVDEDSEVGPWGYLIQYNECLTDGPGPTVGNVGRPGTLSYVRRERYPRVFLNYRRDDAEAYAGRLHESLSREFGPDDVFMDQFSIRPGEAFAWTIQQAAWHAAAMVCLIGRRWMTIEDSRGSRRLGSEYDYVRREISAALDCGRRVIPVILPGGELPGSRHHLPSELHRLGDLQALELSPRHWEAEMKEIVNTIRAVL